MASFFDGRRGHLTRAELNPVFRLVGIIGGMVHLVHLSNDAGITIGHIGMYISRGISHLNLWLRQQHRGLVTQPHKCG